MRRRSLPSFEDPDDASLINLTPLLDVVFVLLITFMLIAPILKVDRVELASSGTLNQRESKRTPLVFTLKADNTLWFQDQRVDAANMLMVFQAQKKGSPSCAPQLIADKRAHFGVYQEVKNALEAAGFESLDVLLK